MILRQSTWKHRVLHNTCRQRGRNIKTRCIRSISDLLKRKDLSSIRRDRTPSSFTIHSHPAFCIPKAIKMQTGEIKDEKVFESPRPPPKMSLRNDWMKDLGSEVARQSDGSQPNQRPQIEFTEQGDLLRQNKRPVRVLRKSTHVSYLAAMSTNMSVELSDKDKDADENVDEDRDKTGRPVGSTGPPARRGRHRLQGVWIATCSCETSRKFSCSLTREEDRESLSSTSSSSRSATK